MNDNRQSKRRWIVGGVVVLWLTFYLFGAWVQARERNTFMWGVDQSAYMSYARQLAQTDYAYGGDRNRMPLYPIIQSLHYREGISNWRYFNQGQVLNLALSVVLLAALYLVLRRRLPPLMTLNMMLITSFTVFMFKAGYFQTELLFYFMFFCVYLMLSRLLVKPDPVLAALAGGMLGLTHLSKASVLPAIALFLGLLALRLLTTLVWPPEGNKDRRLVDLRPSVATLVLVPLVFLLVTLPYLQHSKKVYGHYLYNVNTTFYFWAKDSDEAEYVEAHGDRVGWPDLPDDKIPSLRRYLREHDAADIVARLKDGIERSYNSHRTLDYGYLKFVVLFWAVALAAGITQLGPLLRMLNRQTIWQVLFRLGFLVGYFASYVWYAIINSGQRFMLSIFLPYMFTLTLFISLPRFQQQKIKVGGREIAWVAVFNYAVLLVLLGDLVLIFVGGRVSDVYGGR